MKITAKSLIYGRHARLDETLSKTIMIGKFILTMLD